MGAYLFKRAFKYHKKAQGESMKETFEQRAIIRYLQNLLAEDLSTKALKEMCDFFESGFFFLGIKDINEKTLELIDDYQSAVGNNEGARKLFRKAHIETSKLLEKRGKEIAAAVPGSLEKNIQSISSELNLDDLEQKIFALLVRYRIHDKFKSLLDDLTRAHFGVVELCAICLGADKNKLSVRLRQDGRLLSSGVIIQTGGNGQDIDDFFDIPDIITSAMQKTLITEEDVRKYILGDPLPPSLSWDDFEHLGDNRDKLATFLQKIVEQQIAGVNILLWGPPGTGKTEFSKTLADHLGMNLFALGETDESGDEPDRKERTSSFKIAQNLLRYQKNSLLLFDEMDDLFEGVGLAKLFGVKLSMGSKVFTNRLFENNPVPTIWIINDVSNLDESIIRRMALAIEIKVPPAKSREKVWARLLEKHQVKIPEEELSELAAIEVSPAVANSAVQFAGMVGSSIEDVQFATQGIIRATRGRTPIPSSNNNETYLPDLINAGNDIGLLADRLSASDAQNFSLCLYGPPGTGKSAYARHLAERLGMPVLFKRASDLMSKYVGENEQNIAKAFEEAREKESFLIFDEADSLLSDRRYAERNWEVSQVNEMLTWMECHPIPFACTTNLKERLDQASMRRFTFKCHFDYLQPEQVVIAFKHFFGIELEPQKACNIANLTPGDFAVVSKKLKFLNTGKEVSMLMDLLYQEVEAKNEIQQRQLGFATG